MTTYTPAEIDRLATEFDQMLRWHMTGQEYAAAVLANSKEADPDVCHTHDFIDANMSMLAAWEMVTGQAEIDGDNDADTALWNARVVKRQRRPAQNREILRVRLPPRAPLSEVR